MIHTDRDTIQFPTHMDRAPLRADRSLIDRVRFAILTDQFVIRPDCFVHEADHFPIPPDQFAIHSDHFQIGPSRLAIHADGFSIPSDLFSIRTDCFRLRTVGENESADRAKPRSKNIIGIRDSRIAASDRLVSLAWSWGGGCQDRLCS